MYDYKNFKFKRRCEIGELELELWKEIISIVISNGVFAVLFVWLFFFQIKDSSKREEKYQQTIENLTKSLQSIEDIKHEIVDIKEFLKDDDDYEETL